MLADMQGRVASTVTSSTQARGGSSLPASRPHRVRTSVAKPGRPTKSLSPILNIFWKSSPMVMDWIPNRVSLRAMRRPPQPMKPCYKPAAQCKRIPAELDDSQSQCAAQWPGAFGTNGDIVNSASVNRGTIGQLVTHAAIPTQSLPTIARHAAPLYSVGDCKHAQRRKRRVSFDGAANSSRSPHWQLPHATTPAQYSIKLAQPLAKHMNLLPCPFAGSASSCRWCGDAWNTWLAEAFGSTKAAEPLSYPP